MSALRIQPIAKARWLDNAVEEAWPVCPYDAGMAQAGAPPCDERHKDSGTAQSSTNPSRFHSSSTSRNVHGGVHAHDESVLSHARSASSQGSAHKCRDAAQKEPQGATESYETKKIPNMTPVALAASPFLAPRQTLEELILSRIASFRKAVDKQFELLSNELSVVVSNGVLAESFDSDGSGTESMKPEDAAPERRRRQARAKRKKKKTTALDMVSVPMPGEASMTRSHQGARSEEPSRLDGVSLPWSRRWPSDSQSVYELEERFTNDIIEEAALRAPRSHKSSFTPESPRSPVSPNSRHGHIIDEQVAFAFVRVGGRFSRSDPGLETIPSKSHTSQYELRCSRSLPVNLDAVKLRVPPHKEAYQESREPSITVDHGFDLMFASGSWRAMVATFPIHACGLLLPGPFQESRAGWRGLLYQGFVMVFATACPIMYTWYMISESETSGAMPISTNRLADLTVAFGSVVGLTSVSVFLRGPLVIDQLNVMRNYAAQQSNSRRWIHSSFIDSATMFGIWSAMVMWRAKTDILARATRGEVGLLDATSAFAFAISSGVLISLASLVLHYCRGMAHIVDAFCGRCTDGVTESLVEAARDWNIVQSLLRRSCKSVEVCLLVVQTTIFAAGIAIAVEMLISKESILHSFDRLAPTLALCAAVTRAFFAAADVTNKCSRVPSLVNARGASSRIDPELRHFVDYVCTCEAGFYICEVRLTSYMVMKIIYILGALGFGVLSKMLAG